MPITIFPTLRSRLTLLYFVSTFFIFVLLSGLFSSLLWVALHNQIDHHIHIVTTQAEQVVNNFSGEEQSLLLTNLVNMEGMSIVIISADKKVLLQENSYDVLPLSQTEVIELVGASNDSGGHPKHFSLHGQRFGTAFVLFENQPAILAVGYSTKILQETFVQMMTITASVIMLTLLPLAYIGSQLLKKYLYPLEVVADTARQVTHPKKLSNRVSDLPLTQEISTIVTSFNEMLDRLEKIFANEHEFFSDTAHTLKTPLAVLREKVESLSKESSAQKKEMIEVIDSAVDTVQDLLLISRIETGHEGNVREINVTNITKELLEIAESLGQERKINIRSNIDEQVYIHADERLIKKAFGNVVHNALDYVEDKGLVEITLLKQEYSVIFRVSNSGASISNEEIKKVFGRFYRGINAKQYPHGSGLGLAISKAVVENFHGSIKAKSTTQGKFIVTITF